MTAAEKKRAAHYHQMAECLRRLEVELHHPWAGERVLPEAWHRIAQEPATGRKARLTLWVEEDVLKFFRALGPLWSTRMAEVLSTFMHARLAGVVKGPEDRDYSARLRTPEEEAAKAEREARWDRMEERLAEIFRRRREGR